MYVPAVSHTSGLNSIHQEKAVIKGVFATLYLAGLASPTGPGLGRPAPSGATALVCACVPSEPGSGEAVFVIEEAAGLRG